MKNYLGDLPPHCASKSSDQPSTFSGRLPNGLPVDPNGPSLFTAVQEQLGLKRESARAPVDVLVIDHVEKPTPD